LRIRRIALMVMVGLAPITAALAGDHVPTRDPEVGQAATTIAPQPVPQSAREKSPARPEDTSRQKTLALLILMLKEGRGAR
jgi:hypothetical protein